MPDQYHEYLLWRSGLKNSLHHLVVNGTTGEHGLPPAACRELSQQTKCRNADAATGIVLIALALTVLVAAERLHLVIPAGCGRFGYCTSWPGNAVVAMDQGQGSAMKNRSGGGGGKAMAYFVPMGHAKKHAVGELSTVDCPILAGFVSPFLPRSNAHCRLNR